MHSPSVSDREFFDSLIHLECFQKLKGDYDRLLGHPIWWVSFRVNGNTETLNNARKLSHKLWNDPRMETYAFSPEIQSALHHKIKDAEPFFIGHNKEFNIYCIPLIYEHRLVGYLGLSQLSKAVSQDILGLLSLSLKLVIENCLKSNEAARLSATIRPRAVALSTVHTVHRIINSTLNLDELVSRLAHLIAQVLRAKKCLIYLTENSASTHTIKNPLVEHRRKNKAKTTFVCKAMVGYSKKTFRRKRIQLGEGIEGHVGKTARTVLRRQLICVPLIDEDVIGVTMVSGKKDHESFSYFDQEILTTLAEEAVIAIKNAQLYEDQKKVTLGTIQSLASVLGSRLPHSSSPELFLDLVLKVAEEMRLSDEETQALHYATLLKDTAKIGIPEEILKKRTKLTGKEYRLLHSHTIEGAKIVQSFESLKPVVPIILYSREKYDGTGYPSGLKGDQIPVGARILAVINAFEAIIVGRPYRSRASVKQAVDEILKNSGTQFDPHVVHAFVKTIKHKGFYRIFKNVKPSSTDNK